MNGLPGTEAQLAACCQGSDEDIDIAEASLLLAALDLKHCDLKKYRSHLSEISEKVSNHSKNLAPDDVSGRGAVLRHIIAEQYDYFGDNLSYDDIRNASLCQVIDRRRGLPIAISIIYLSAARAQSWQAEGINFPGHFLIRIEAEGSRAIIDPFNGGIERNSSDLRDLLKHISGIEAELTPEHYAPITNRQLLIRLLNNIKVRAISLGDLDHASQIIERMLIVDPDESSFLREAGLCYTRLGALDRARSSYERCIKLTTDPRARMEVEILLRNLIRKLH